MKCSPLRFRYVALTLLAILVTWFAVGRLRSSAIVGPGELLSPTGPSRVGRVSYHLHEDSSGAVADGRPPREVMVHLWYPAAPAPTAKRAPYIPDFAAIEKAVGAEPMREVAGATYEALSSARANAFADAPLADKPVKLPVILLTHGLRFNALGYSMLAEDLASHGYLVIGVEHPATAFALHFPQGRVKLFDEALWTQRRSPEETQEFERQQVNRCAEDLQFVLGQLQPLQSGVLASPIHGRLDLERIGVFGHSFGGRVAARACQIDNRLRAGVVCDGFGRRMTVAKQADGSTVDQPMMVQYARRVPLHGWERTLALLQTPGSDLEAELRAARQEFCQSVTAGSYELTLNTPGIMHESFSDMPLIESGQTETTRRERKRAMEITRTFTRAFFDLHLLDQPAPLLDDVPYNPEEVELTRHTFPRK